MKQNYFNKILISFVLILSGVPFSFAQISEGGIPKSFELINNKTQIDKMVLDAPNVEQLKQEDIYLEKNGVPERCGINLPLGITPENAGTWTELENGEKIWRLEITSKGAQAIGVYYDVFEIPENGKLFLYTADKKRIIGAYTSKNNPKHTKFATEALIGDDIIIEYNETPITTGFKKACLLKQLNLVISNVAYFYKGFNNITSEKGFGGSDNCEVNVNCSPVGDDWQDEKRGVAKIVFPDGGSAYYCTGSLVNNTNQDCKPYFLTAFHCGATTSASEHNQWVFYFNYEASGCSNPSSEPSANTITGCSVKTTSNIDGGSDLQLVELNTTPSESWHPYYNGWTRSTTASSSGVGIHHPSGDIKKISTYSSTLQSAAPNIDGSHMQSGAAWRVTWSSNDNGWGVTEGGSSGSPLFNSSGLIIGTLTGGSSSCSNQSNNDFYGKFDHHWTNGNLAQFLDPAGTGSTSLNGTNAPCNGGGVTANFTASATTIAVGTSVTFTDQSTSGVTSWSWTFNGGSPNSSTTQNPTVTYNTVGTYDVSLTVSDGTNSDTENKTSYIHVVEAGTVCDTIDVFGIGSSTATLYGVQGNGGYVTGTNKYGDTRKANFYDHSVTANNILKGAFFSFGRATSGTNPNITFEVLDGSNGTPGDVIKSVTKPLSEIVDAVNNNNGSYYVDFGDVNVTTNFFVSFSCGLDMSAGDTIAIVSNTNGDVTNKKIAWEEYNGSWSTINSGWNDLTISLAIFPILCPDNVQVLDYIDNSIVKLYPNPTSGIVYIEGLNSFKKIQILDIQGKVVKSIDNFTTIININNLSKGNYIVRIITDNEVITKRLTLIK